MIKIAAAFRKVFKQKGELAMLPTQTILWDYQITDKTAIKEEGNQYDNGRLRKFSYEDIFFNYL